MPGTSSSSTSGQSIFCRIEKGLRLGAVARRRAGEREAGHAGGEALRKRAPDRAETGNGYPGFVHRGSVRHALVRLRLLRRAANVAPQSMA